jgi:hypothetical protein
MSANKVLPPSYPNPPTSSCRSILLYHFKSKSQISAHRGLLTQPLTTFEVNASYERFHSLQSCFLAFFISSEGKKCATFSLLPTLTGFPNGTLGERW